ncbi:hypothetical protein ACVR0P_01830 [Streptococcus castoreus]|nr:hypothetical protein [Streptococcus castoreus]
MAARDRGKPTYKKIIRKTKAKQQLACLEKMQLTKFEIIRKSLATLDNKR